MAPPPLDVGTDDCLPEYRHLFCPDLLQDKVAFITGGGSGIGFRIAEIFMRHGCRTVIASRSFPRVSMAAEKLSAATGQQCLPLSMDVRSPPAVMAAVDQALKTFGKIDILINCAAGNFLCPAGALSFNAFKTVVDIDTIGTFNVSRVLYEKFFRDHGGVIVNITATLCFRGQMLQVHAGSAKAAVDAMTRHLAVEWGPKNIRVNSLAPGPISGTEGFRRLGKVLFLLFGVIPANNLCPVPVWPQTRCCLWIDSQFSRLYSRAGTILQILHLSLQEPSDSLPRPRTPLLVSQEGKMNPALRYYFLKGGHPQLIFSTAN
ncbi:peroxisomal 2,4-dienoyl-CoA reductase [(3E)-enoyl-CoA-producing] isoform 1-T1 [Thomomys bottae]